MSEVVKFVESRDKTPMATLHGKVAFPERSGKQPAIGEIWEVEVAGENSSGKVLFLRLVRKVQLVEWKWNDGIMSRERKPACLVITPSGEVFRFTGGSIPGVVQVVNSEYHKSGKWSNTDYSCVSPQGTAIHSWFQSWEEGVYWPEASWEEAFQTIQRKAPHVDVASLEKAIREQWYKAAEKFDENRATISAYAFLSPPTTTESPVICNRPSLGLLPPSGLSPQEEDDDWPATPSIGISNPFAPQLPSTVTVPIELLKRLMAGNTDIDAVMQVAELLPEN